MQDFEAAMGPAQDICFYVPEHEALANELEAKTIELLSKSANTCTCDR